jgi:hypothetical protein
MFSSGWVREKSGKEFFGTGISAVPETAAENIIKIIIPAIEIFTAFLIFSKIFQI